ncbi:MAG: stage III sporulation protein AE [Firmicutes bacterium]|nr:stage III sporulation protein AE [Bacillota bacterium]
MEEQLDTASFEAILSDIDKLLAEADSGFSLEQLWRDYRAGERQLDLSLFWDAFCALFFRALRSSAGLLAQVLSLAVLSAVLGNLQSSGAQGEVAQLSRWVMYLLLLTLALLAWEPAVQSAQEAVSLLRDILLASLPLLLPLLASLGALSTVSLMSPLLFAALELLTTLLSSLVFPLVYLSAVLRLMSGLGLRFSLSKLADLFKDVAMGSMSILTTVFLAVLSFVGVASSSSDGLAIKAVKTASSAFVPVVGRTLADSLDSVLGTSLLLKNTIGLLGALAILLACAIPALRLLAQSLIFRLAAALVQPLGERELSEALGGMGKSLTQLFAVVAMCGLFGFFTFALMVGLGNLTMMMR